MKTAITPKNSMREDGNNVLNFKPQFAKRFKMLRLKYDLSHSALSNLFCLKSPTSISNIESNRAFPSFELMNKTIILFAISADWLLGYSDEPYNETLISKIEASLTDTISKLGIDYDVKNYSLEERAKIIFLLQAVNGNTEKYLPLLLKMVKK